MRICQNMGPAFLHDLRLAAHSRYGLKNLSVKDKKRAKEGTMYWRMPRRKANRGY